VPGYSTMSFSVIGSPGPGAARVLKFSAVKAVTIILAVNNNATNAFKLIVFIPPPPIFGNLFHHATHSALLKGIIEKFRQSTSVTILSGIPK
ncbi:MAG: hypothetical protein OEZ40_10030, partial [Candidatus Bathyarchaeota archaeon]|nr:hypothetical protein [Candidatus Bathyarchaeota archaeon]